MNLQAIVGPAVGAITAPVALTINQSTGWTQNADFSRTPTYQTTSITGQVQPITTGDLRLMESLNIQGVHRRVYVQGEFFAVVRAAHKGGDLVTFPDSTVWKITAVPEDWQTDGWTCFICTMQDGS